MVRPIAKPDIDADMDVDGIVDNDVNNVDGKKGDNETVIQNKCSNKMELSSTVA